MGEKVQKMLEMRAQLELGGGQAQIDKFHAKGKLTARERLNLLFDPGTFVEYNLFMKHRCTRFGMDKVSAPGEGLVTGHGLIEGRKCFAFAHDFTVLGAALGEMQGLKMMRVQELALEAGVPIIGLNESGGARIQEGPDASAYGAIFYRNVQSSGVIPQISAIMGSCAGGAAYSPALTDFVVSVDKTSQMFICGPNVIKSVTGEIVEGEELGGAMTHNSRSGVAHLLAIDDHDCINQIKRLLTYLPANCYELPTIYECTDDPKRRNLELNDMVPENSRKSYNIKNIITTIADEHDFFEIQPYFAPNIVVGFIRMNGMPVGVVANQTSHMAGCIDINAADKSARFIRTCDAFNIPLLSIVDVPGYLPGTNQEWGGIIRHGAKMLYAWAEATVPKIVLAVGKVFGGANAAMCSRDMEPDYIIAWPTAQRAVMGAEGAVNVLYKKELAKAENPEELRATYISEYNEEFMNPYRAAERGKFDDVIEPSETRAKIIATLNMFWGKTKERRKRKHGNLPV